MRRQRSAACSIFERRRAQAASASTTRGIVSSPTTSWPPATPHPRPLCPSTQIALDTLARSARVVRGSGFAPPFGELLVEHEPDAGELLLFPPWLGHEVQYNCGAEGGEPRVSVSFNFAPTPEEIDDGHWGAATARFQVLLPLGTSNAGEDEPSSVDDDYRRHLHTPGVAESPDTDATTWSSAQLEGELADVLLKLRRLREEHSSTVSKVPGLSGDARLRLEELVAEGTRLLDLPPPLVPPPLPPLPPLPPAAPESPPPGAGLDVADHQPKLPDSPLKCTAECSAAFVDGCMRRWGDYQRCWAMVYHAHDSVGSQHAEVASSPLSEAGCTPDCTDTPAMAALATTYTNAWWMEPMRGAAHAARRDEGARHVLSVGEALKIDDFVSNEQRQCVFRQPQHAHPLSLRGASVCDG
jgi:hypothetical protein